ncbi:MAG: PRC-barrel domain-containing protein, partial [Firmicutes bacterium]|nr:PRC-barrel domain-containing protein [Bacillota bacterium]
MLSTDKLKNREVINIRDGRSLGFICDIEVNLEKGTIEGIVIPAGKR